MKKIRVLLIVLLACFTITSAKADPQTEATPTVLRPPRDALLDADNKGDIDRVAATHDALRAMRDGLLDAVNKSDIDRELTFLTTNVVVTWHDATVSRGREGVRDYYNRMVNGPNKIVADFHADIKVDELTILYGDNTGIAFGSALEHFKFTNGKSIDLTGRWTATMIKQDGRWLVAALHVSSDIFDNVVLEMVKKYAIRSICLVFVVSITMGWLLGRIRHRPRLQTPSSP